VPEVDETHDDRPILLRFVPHGNNADVRVSVPAAGTDVFPEILVHLNADETQTLDLTDYIDLLENTEFDVVADKGLFIHSTEKISVYYEVASSSNADVFSLKGQNALGTLFYTCFQNFWNNKRPQEMLPWNDYFSQDDWALNSWSAFDIVATEDSTLIEILPTQPVLSQLGFDNIRPAGETYQILLNKGQTYSGRAFDRSAAGHLSGTKISVINGNKPIAVTIKDDALIAWGSHEERLGGDLVGDQIIPVALTGTEYIVMSGAVEPFNNTEGDYTGERVFVTGTEDNTTVSLYDTQGLVVETVRVDEQETVSFLIDNYDYVKIESTSNIYVFHVSGVKYELGGAIIPPLSDCSGSRKMSFTKSYMATTTSYLNNDINFRMNLMVKKGAEGCFTLDGRSAAWIKASMFEEISGTDWLFATFVPNKEMIEVGNTYLLENSCDVFHLGILNASRDGGKGAFYGYFSPFYNIDLSFDLLNGEEFCEGDTVYMAVQSSAEYELNGLMQYVTEVATDTFMVAGMPPGIYSYSASVVDGCGMDEQQNKMFTVYETPRDGLFDEDILCFDSVPRFYETKQYDGGRYQWSTENAVILGAANNSEAFVFFNAAGDAVIHLAVDNHGCTNDFYDTVRIVEMPVPVLSLVDSSLCQHDTIILNASINTPDAEFQWYGSGEPYLTESTYLRPSFIGSSTGEFQLTLRAVAENTCMDEDSISVTVYPNPDVFAGFDSVLFRNQSITMEPKVSNYGLYSAEWSPIDLFIDNLRTDAQTVPFRTEEQNVFVTVTEIETGNRCKSADSLILRMADTLRFVEKNSNIQICQGDSLGLIAKVSGGFEDAYTYHWYINGEHIEELQSDSSVYLFENPSNEVKVVVADSFDEIEHTFYVRVHQMPILDFTYPPNENLYPNTELTFINNTNKLVDYPTVVYQWDLFGNGNYIQATDSVKAVYGYMGVYNVTLFAEDTVTTCKAELSKPIDIVPNPECFVLYPNAVLLSSAGDDYFSANCVKGILKEGYEMRIFNRWGQLLYETTDLEFRWDCIYKDSYVLQDVYVYQTKHTCENGTKILTNGDITVLK